MGRKGEEKQNNKKVLWWDSDSISEPLWFHLKFPLEDRRVLVADSNSEQIVQGIFPESEVWLIEIQISFYGNMQYVFAPLKNVFYFFPVL